ncbi:uncharacterized protein STEHIDRAFT_82762 [Stereum hirsutum FP-91666 SS1]|uniref:uncharacterized protein n=1 Tax=Stereum hirsutum (strain FP-91666) TaxID=721885 RepID=UPI0004449A0D|nr:uncharacterized protein STEHIDRAFT_82762 [Stereum hirsutum FP-91666 SS1]EIM83867.1 hypothetical protein STEHIDRAFT_82762 [Stereum hirsutum FP-91666 SS1]
MFTQSIVAALVALPFVAQSALAADCTRNYTIQAGDVCDSISAAQNVSTYQISVVNDGIINSNCTDLTPDQSICLGYSGEDCTTTHVVAANETCDDITTAAGINSTMLFLNNPQIDTACDNIYIGEVLCTASTVAVPAAPSGSVPATSIPATATAATASASAAVADDDDEDDDDLPFCDEL